MLNNSILTRTRPAFTMLVGVPGSGKSTFAKSLVNENTKHFSSDAIREELWGDANCQDNPGEVFALMQKRTLEALRSGYDVIYDATNITRKSRWSILSQLPAHITKKCIIVWAPIQVCLERDLARERTVGAAVIDKMLRRFEAPFYDEGFDTIEVHITTEHNDFKYYDECMKALDITHDNPHHTADVAEHCMLCGDNLLAADLPSVVKFAGYVHDIGKPYTKTFLNKKGELTDIAHYYDHHSVGAWISYGFPTNDITLAWLVGNHMAPFINLKYYNNLDPLYKTWITVLHNADRDAH